MKTVIFDNIIFSLQKAGGISVVWAELLKSVTNSIFEYKCFEYNNCNNNIFRNKIEIPRQSIIHKNCLCISIQRYFNPKLTKIKKDEPFIFHSSYYRYCDHKNAINFITVHDFIYEYFSSGIKKYLHCYQKYKAIRNSTCIICISETTKRDLLKFVKGIDEKAIHVVYNGVSDDYCVLKKEDRNDLLYGKFVVFVGSRNGYKNFDIAVSAIKRTNLNLVIVGSPLSNQENSFLEKELGANRFFVLSGISNENLNRLYNTAHCLLYPSSYEGFGIPVLEAQKAGCPVIIANTPSVVEIIGNMPLIVELNNIDSIVEKINLLNNNSIRQDVIQAGLKNVENYSWNKMAEQIIALYQETFNKKTLE
jgi:mannosyltransferase